MKQKQHQRFALDQVKRRIEFEVSQDSDWMAFQFDWDISLSWEEMRIFDPAGRLRYIHWDVNHERKGLLHRDPEQNSYLGVPGDVPAGKWRIEFQKGAASWLDWSWEYGTGELPEDAARPPAGRELWSDGQTSADGRNFVLNLYDWDQVREQGERWYKGDFHAHTILSDGQMTPTQVMELAESLNLDFYNVTEHNALPASWPRSRVLAIPGTELTSNLRGDWNVIGLKQSLDYGDTVYPQTENDTDERYSERQRALRQRTRQLGAIRSLNHPMINRKFGWGDRETPLCDLDAFELWHCPSIPRHPSDVAALLLWTSLWNDGYTVAGIGGSDFHCSPGVPFAGAVEWQPPGDPLTYVWADRLTPNAILEGVRKRHVYISRGPELHVSFECGGQQFRVGDDLTAAVREAGGVITGRVEVSGMEGGSICLVENGEPSAQFEVTDASSSASFTLNWQDKGYTWCRIECRSSEGRLLAITNPIFAGRKTPELFTWKQLLDRVESVAPGTLKLLEVIPESRRSKK